MKLYPSYSILEEFGIPDSRLSLDFFIPSLRLAFEFQGVQHDEFNKHFHGDSGGFKRQQKRDAQKAAWCDMNDIRLIEIRSGCVTIEELRKIILDYEQ